jgi:DNA-binding NtrC family response regulator
MGSIPVSVLASTNRSRTRTAVVVSSDRSFRRRLTETLTGLRWKVSEAEGGAQVWTDAAVNPPEAVIVDSWLPDLDLHEFLADFRASFPATDLVTTGESTSLESKPGPYRQELLYALHRSQETDTVSWNTAPALSCPSETPERNTLNWLPASICTANTDSVSPSSAINERAGSAALATTIRKNESAPRKATKCERLPELIGDAPCMLEVSRRIRLVAPRNTPVLIEGPTGSGKELVAEAVHRLSNRNRKPFIAINCAAIPEALLEAELFGHTRGAFTGAVQGRIGRIEAADGGTLFLDEIGEMPLNLQSKLLRFVECGELQRVGDNETVKVDVRIVAATHRHLAQQAQAGGFRSDLYYRLAVFLIRTPALSWHSEDLPLLVEHFLKKMGHETPVKHIDEDAMVKLAAHDWPGNVRELEHVLERAAILAGDETLLTAQDIDFGLMVN